MIIWVDKKRKASGKDCDVKLFLCKQEEGRPQRISITFYNDTAKNLSETDYIKIGYNGEGIYFLGCSNKAGHKMVIDKKTNSGTRYTMLTLADAKPEWAGLYKLEFDMREMCHCIKFDKKVG